MFSNYDFIKKKFHLYDQDNNYMTKICVALPKNLNKCSEITNYINDPILKSYYQDIPMENFFFISSNDITALDIFIESHTDLYKHKGKTKINYRIQPFSKEEKHEFHQHKKHFISFTSKDNNFIAHPIVVFISTTEKFSVLKKLIFDKINKINYLNLLEIPLNKYKFYTCEFNNYYPRKLDIINNRDDDFINQIHKSDILNILVEVPRNVDNRQLKIGN